VENGTLEDGFAWGRYASNDTATLIAEERKDGAPFVCWLDKLGNHAGYTATLSVAVKDNDRYTAAYGEMPEIPTDPKSLFEYSVSGSSITITKYVGMLTEVIVPATIDGVAVTAIGNSAFASCHTLTSIELPSSIRTIYDSAFYNCTGLTEMTIPEGVASIGRKAFSYCTGLKSVEIPSTVQSIGSYAFEGCASITSVYSPDSVTKIGERALYGCSNLTSVVILDSVTSIGWYAFQNCSSLTSVVIPDSVTSIGSSAFKGCSSLTIYCEATSQPSTWYSSWNPNYRPVKWGYTS
jgi:hypothetical protein